MAANSKTVTATGQVSPKVFYPLVVGLGLTFLASLLAAVTPEMLSALGPFAVPTATALVSVAGVLAGYLKRDELRDIGVEATAAILPDAPVTSEVTPDVDTVDIDVVEDDTTAADLQAELSSLRVSDGTGSHRAEGPTA